MDYWLECINSALDEAGVIANTEQRKAIAGAVKFAHEDYGISLGYEHIPNHLKIENENLKKDLKTERDKVVCPDCNGRGFIATNICCRRSYSSCSKCNGIGRI